MRYLSVCSGIEAATVAWHPLGWQPAGLSEIDKFPRAVLEQRLGAVAVDWDHRHSPQSNVLPLFGDFTQIEEHHVGPIDLLVGGTPCQSFSIAGKRLGLDDPRGNLAIEFLALARRLRPRWLVWENVPGVRSSWSGDAPGEAGNAAGWHEWTESCDFAAFLDLFRECGYRGGWRTFDAQFIRVDGFERAVPQRRERVFVVGYLGDFARAGTVLFERESLFGNPAPRRQAGQGVAAPLAKGSDGGSGYRNDADTTENLVCATLDANFGRLQGCSGQDLNHGHSHLVAFGGNNTAGPIDVATAVNSHGGPHGGPHGRQDFESETFVAHALRADGFDASEDGTGRGTPLVAVMGFSSKDYGNDAVENISPTLRSMGHDGSHANGGGQVAVAFDTTQITSAANRSNPQNGDPCHPLAAEGHPPAVAFSIMPMNSGKDYKARETDVAQPVMAGGPVGGNQGGDVIAESWAVRRLTPRECERLQGFPDDWTLIDWRGKQAPDGPRYKAIGNSMAVNVMRWLGERVEYVERACAEAEGPSSMTPHAKPGGHAR